MILQALSTYYYRLEREGGTDIASEGFAQKEIPFLIVIKKDGKFIALQDTRTPSGKKLVARKILVPKERERSGTNAWKEANLLWDHYGYVLGWPKSDTSVHKDMALKQHTAFVAETKALHDKYPDDLEIKAVYQFLSEGNPAAVFVDPHWTDCKKIPGCNLSFILEGEKRLICQSENVQAYVTSKSISSPDDEENGDTKSDAEGLCLVTGEYGPIARLHPRTPILYPPVPIASYRSKSNAKIVSFQKHMGFDSYGKEQSFNAPIGKRTAFAYATALNRMLARDSRQKIQVGDATTVFWAENESKMEGAFANIFGEAPKGEPEQDYKHIISLFRSPESGATVKLDRDTKFYVLGLSPNAARIAVRFWYAGTVGSIADNIGQHFDDIDMVKGPNEWRTIGLHWLLRATALQSEDKNIAPNLAGDTMKAILTGTPYPRTLLVSVINRTRAEQSKKDSSGKSIPNVTYTRAALIKAILTRETRYYKRNEKEVGMSLDTSNTNPGYLLGRLFAVLERTQEESARPNTLNTTIRGSFYGAASSTPVAVFPHLMKLKNYHIAKLEKENKGQAVNLEKQFGEIVNKLDANGAFPTHLTLPDQGRFAVGYYHQRQNFFTKKDNSKNNIEEESNE